MDGKLPNAFIADEAGALPNSYPIEAMRSGQLNILNKLGFITYQVTKYLLARRLLNGQCHTVGYTSGNLKSLLSKIRSESNKMTFLRNDANLAGVYNSTEKANQYILIDSDIDSEIDVNELAYAFQMSKADIETKKVLIDGFGNLDNARLNVLLGDNPNYVAIDDTDKALLNTIPAVLVDENFFMIFDKLFEMHNETFNQDGLYRQHTLHNWRVYATSAFSNNAVFVTGTPAVSAVTVSPSTVTLSNGTATQYVQMGVSVTASNFASQAVTWSVDSTAADAGVTIDERGKVTIPKTWEDAAITVTAKSVLTPSVTGTATITVGTVE